MREWWNDEIAYWTHIVGCSPEAARTFTILRWLGEGDLRPLEAAIVEGHQIDQAVLNLVADMISSDATRFGEPPPYRLKAVPLRRGRPKNPEHLARNVLAALAYKKRENGEASDEAFDRIAKRLGTSDRTIRQAVTAFRKSPHYNKI
jgi:hypothetical protein